MYLTKCQRINKRGNNVSGHAMQISNSLYYGMHVFAKTWQNMCMSDDIRRTPSKCIVINWCGVFQKLWFDAKRLHSAIKRRPYGERLHVAHDCCGVWMDPSEHNLCNYKKIHCDLLFSNYTACMHCCKNNNAEPILILLSILFEAQKGGFDRKRKLTYIYNTKTRRHYTRAHNILCKVSRKRVCSCSFAISLKVTGNKKVVGCRQNLFKSFDNPQYCSNCLLNI